MPFIRNRITSVFGLRAEEMLPVRLLWTHSFFLGIAIAYFTICATSLFFAQFHIDTLPFILIAAGIIHFCINIIIQKYEHKIESGQLHTIVLLFLLISTIVFWFGLFEGLAGWVIFCLLLWSRIMERVLHIEFWSLSSVLFDVRQGKRLFGLIDSGSFLARILGFLSVPFLVPVIGVSNLLLVTVASFFCALYYSQRITKYFKEEFDHFHHKTQESSETHQQNIVHILRNDPFILSVGVLAFFAFLAMTCIDFGFLREVEFKFGEENEIAVFLGLFFGIGKLLGLLMKFFISGRLFGRFGLEKLLMVLPVILLIIMVSGIVASMNGSSMAMIWLFSTNMLFVEVWGEAIHVPALAISFQPLPAKRRMQAHSVIQGTLEPVAISIAGIFLLTLVLTSTFSLLVLQWTLLGILTIWIFAIVRADKSYKEVIKSALRHHHLDKTDNVWDNDTKVFIENIFKNGQPIQISYALDLIPKKETSFYIAILKELLEHPSTDIQIEALQKLEIFSFTIVERRELQNLFKEISERDGINDSLLGGIIYAYCVVTEDLDEGLLMEWIHDEREDIQKGLIAGLIRHQGIDRILMGGERLLEFIHNSLPSKRRLAAEIVGKIGSNNFYRPLLNLLRDSDSTVRLTAIEAAAFVHNERLLEPLIDLLFNREQSAHINTAITESLYCYGDQCIPFLQKKKLTEYRNPQVFHRVLRLLERIGSYNAQSYCLELLGTSELKKSKYYIHRFWLLEALVHFPPVPEISLTFVRLFFEEELSHVEWLIETLFTVRNNFTKDTYHTLLYRSLAWELERSADRILLLLALLFDKHTMLIVRESLLFGSKEHRANALEVVESTLPPSISNKLIQILEDSEGQKEIIRLLTTRGNPATLPELCIDILNNHSKNLEHWTIALAMIFASKKIGIQVYSIGSHTVEPSDPSIMEVSQVIDRMIRNDEIFTTTTIIMSQTIERMLLLRSVDLFTETSDPVLAHIARSLQEEHYSSGITFVKKGEIGKCLYVIAQGKVRVHDGETTFAELGSHDVVGELSLFDPEPRSASVTTLEDTTILRLDRDIFYDLIEDNPEIARGAITTLSRRLRTVNQKLLKIKPEL